MLRLAEVLPEVILGGAGIWAHVTGESGHLGHSNVQFRIFNATNMKLNRTRCNGDHCSWADVVNGRTENDNRPKEVIGPQSRTEGKAVRGESGVGVRNIETNIEYTPEG